MRPRPPPADRALVGPLAPRVKGGIDLVGDSYNADPKSATYQPMPHPDPNPLDCNGHGSHVAGTAAGSGVSANGQTYNGPYNASTVSGNSWTIGPGVAPKADLYAVRVFGCEGSTDVIVDAIEWAVDNDMDVINMSLGSPFGTKDDPVGRSRDERGARPAWSSSRRPATRDRRQYITGSPGTADGAIADGGERSAAVSPASEPATPTGDSNLRRRTRTGRPSRPARAPLVVLKDNPAPRRSGIRRLGNESLGCDRRTRTTGIARVVGNRCRQVAARVPAWPGHLRPAAGAAAAAMIDNCRRLPPSKGRSRRTRTPANLTP